MSFASKGYVDSKIRAVDSKYAELITSGTQRKGVWNAATNTPSLNPTSGNNGDWYDVSVEGDWDGRHWRIGDKIIFNSLISTWEQIPTGVEKDDEAMLIGFITENSTFPETRPSGKPLVIGDYLKVDSNANLPFEIDDSTGHKILFDSYNDEAEWNGTRFQEKSYQVGKTNEIGVNKPEEESFDGTAEYQSDINKYIVEVLKDFCKDTTFNDLDTIATTNILKRIYHQTTDTTTRSIGYYIYNFENNEWEELGSGSIKAGNTLPNGKQVGELFILLQDVDGVRKTKKGLYRYDGNLWVHIAYTEPYTSDIEVVNKEIESISGEATTQNQVNEEVVNEFKNLIIEKDDLDTLAETDILKRTYKQTTDTEARNTGHYIYDFDNNKWVGIENTSEAETIRLVCKGEEELHIYDGETLLTYNDLLTLKAQNKLLYVVHDGVVYNLSKDVLSATPSIDFTASVKYNRALYEYIISISTASEVSLTKNKVGLFNFVGFVSSTPPLRVNGALWYQGTELPNVFPIKVKICRNSSWVDADDYTPNLFDIWEDDSGKHVYWNGAWIYIGRDDDTYYAMELKGFISATEPTERLQNGLLWYQSETLPTGNVLDVFRYSEGSGWSRETFDYRAEILEIWQDLNAETKDFYYYNQTLTLTLMDFEDNIIVVDNEDGTYTITYGLDSNLVPDGITIAVKNNRICVNDKSIETKHFANFGAGNKYKILMVDESGNIALREPINKITTYTTKVTKDGKTYEVPDIDESHIKAITDIDNYLPTQIVASATGYDLICPVLHSITNAIVLATSEAIVKYYYYSITRSVIISIYPFS